MNFEDFKFLADENIHPEVIAFLKAEEIEVYSVFEKGLAGASDAEILQVALENDWIVLTHDSDFGTLVYTQMTEFTGIIYLRPGHILPEFTINSLKTLITQSLDFEVPFIIVAEKAGDTVKIRIRHF